MRKAYLVAGFCALAGALAISGKASADLITNGNFSLGNVGFTSDYTPDSTQNAGLNAGSLSGAGYYGIVADSQYWHPYFVDFQDHTQDGSAASDPSNTSGNPDAGYMMIINGNNVGTDNVGTTTVWSESGIAVTPGVTYNLSFWAASAYPVSPATLDITASINNLNTTFDLGSDAGVWHQFSMNFVATDSPTTVSIIDSNIELNGNDFAIDDISLTPVPANDRAIVPLPASFLSGSVLMAGIALANKIRRSRLH